MSQKLFTNIGQLVTNDPVHDGSMLGIIESAAILVDGEDVTWVGEEESAPKVDDDCIIDMYRKAVVPGFVDSHNHLIFDGDRSRDFQARMAGGEYAPRGIHYTVEQTRLAGENELRGNLAHLVSEARKSGTTTLEIKSGYGLNVAKEVMSLRLAQEVSEETTFLGAHIVPQEFLTAPDDYVDLVIGEMLDACAPYAKWIDVFCDRGAFTSEQTRKILSAGIAKGLMPRLHAHQLERGEGIAIGVEMGAASVDHISHVSDEDLQLLADSSTVATLLPGAEFSTRSPYPDARRFWDAGITVALATDCNPGSSFTNSMPFIMAVAVRDMFFTPEQALWSATAGGAAALRRSDIGRIAPGCRADFLLLDAPSYIHLAYRPGVQLIEQVWRNGSQLI